MLDGLLRLLAERVLPDLYAPHPSHAFDGPFTRISTPAGTFVVILSSIKDAPSHGNLVHVSFTPLASASDDDRALKFAADLYPAAVDVRRRPEADRGRTAAWSWAAELDDGSMRYDVDDDRQTYRATFVADGRKLRLEIDICHTTPYSTLGPMSFARFMPSSIYWHAFSTRSDAHVVLSEASGRVLYESDGLAHLEKNWGALNRISLTDGSGPGFPTGGWLWGQAFCRQSAGSLVFAGGDVVYPVRSLFLAVRTPAGRAWNFGPVSTTQLFGLGPGIVVEHDSRQGAIGIVTTDHLRGRRVRVKAQAPVETFMPMAAPLPGGHDTGCARAAAAGADRADCHESYAARYDVVLEERRWTLSGPRYEVAERLDLEEGAPLEFGGQFSHWAREKAQLALSTRVYTQPSS